MPLEIPAARKRTDIDNGEITPGRHALGVKHKGMLTSQGAIREYVHDA
jgi:hypothetical protein